jgi:chromate reductase, NAD(P)H dehydrogenase (quinone)
MAPMAKILAFAGSTRADSWNKMLLRIAIEGAKEMKADVTLLGLEDFKLPIYDYDDEKRNGIPAAGLKLKSIFMAHQGFLLACPEYNSSITAVLKNTIDWVSRPIQGEAKLGCFVGQVAALMSASTGHLGGVRGLSHVRSILENIGVLVIPAQICVPHAPEAFDEKGLLKSEHLSLSVKMLGATLTEVVRKMT